MRQMLDPKKTLFVHVHWMKYYDGRKGDEAYAGGQSRDGHMEDYNFLDYDGEVFGGFWPGRRRRGDNHAKQINVARLGARREANAKGITVVFFAPAPDDGHLRMIGWYDDAVVYRDIQIHPDDGGWYNVTAPFEGTHLVPYRERKTTFDFSGWWKQGAYRYADAAPMSVLTSVQREMRRSLRR